MKTCGALVALVAVAAGVHTVHGVTPVQQVIQMLSELQATGSADAQEERHIFKDYTAWKEKRAADLGYEIKTGKKKIEKLLATIEMDSNTIQKLADAISNLNAEISTLEKDKSESEARRAEDRSEFEATRQDYSESVDALQRAIQTLKSQDHENPEAAAALLQRLAAKVTRAGPALGAYLQSGTEEPGAPSVEAYSFQSSSIIGVLEQLLEKFSGELKATEEAEANTAHAHALKMIHLKDSLAYANSDREEKTAHKARVTAHKAKAVGELGTTKAQLEADERLLADTITTYTAKKATFEVNQRVRADELTALEEAIKIMSSDKVSGSYAEHINLAQSGKVTSFLQVASTSAQARQRATMFLEKRAKELRSQVLSGLVANLASGNPFAKVATMIKDLIARLKENAAAESEHKAWCDQQLKQNKHKRDKRTATSNSMAAEEEELKAEIADKAQLIQTLIEEQAALAKAMEEATVARQKEKAANEHAIADAEVGIEAVKRAIVVLTEFYAGAAALLQQVPEMAAYHGQQRSKTGVIGMLEVIETDFTRLKTDTEASEAQAAAEHRTFMRDSKADRDQKHNAEVKTSLEKDNQEFELSELEKDHASVDKELAAASEYYEYLKPLCLEVHVNYEERVARRQEEIAALKEAYSILDSKTRSD